MNDALKTIRWVEMAAILAIFSIAARAAIPNTETIEIIYATGFEATEGFDSEYTIPGQDEWQSTDEGDGGSGLVDDFFEGQGQQAYIGRFPLESDEAVDSLSLFRFVSVTNFPVDAPIINFNVTMEIVDSTNNERDNFRWVVFNLKNDFLFLIDFDNETRAISYLLDDDKGAIGTGFKFDYERIYDLRISMNFRRNLWCASLDETVIVNNQPITTKNVERTFSGVDAMWDIYNSGRPGDNYMLFDNYSIIRAGPPRIAPGVNVQGILPDGKCVLRVSGELDAEYQIEASSDLKVWTPIKTGRTSADEGILDVVDDQAPRFIARFYRAVTVP